MKLILASTSRYRRELLSRLRVPFSVEDPGVDEAAFKIRGLAPRELAETLAREKCDSVSRKSPQSIVIGSDQVVALAGLVLGKPGSVDNAVAQLRSMAGKTHELITAMRVRRGDTQLTHTDVTRITLLPLDEAALRRYVEADEPVDCSGSYKIESLGISLFQSIISEDPTSVQGLPLMALCRILRELGVRIP